MLKPFEHSLTVCRDLSLAPLWQMLLSVPMVPVRFGSKVSVAPTPLI